MLPDMYSSVSARLHCDTVEDNLMDIYINEWRNNINQKSGLSGNGRKKLRTYRLFKHSYETECST